MSKPTKYQANGERWGQLGLTQSLSAKLKLKFIKVNNKWTILWACQVYI